MLQLRNYQQEAVDAVYQHLRQRDDNPCVVIPTAGGKTPLMATICRDAVLQWGGRVLILAHVKELLEQSAATLSRISDNLDVGVYSAGLKRRDTDNPVVVAGIQSIYKRACELGPFDLIIADECHLVPESGEGRYRSFLADAQVVNPNVRLIGLTATPYRMTTGMICGPENLLNHVCYEVGVRELIVQGYLCPLKSKAGRRKVDTSALHIRGGEFIAAEVEDLMDEEALVTSACEEILEQTENRSSVLIFAAGIQHARHIQQTLQKRSHQEVQLITGNTPAPERAEILARFKREEVKADLFGNVKPPLKYLVNVNVLTTGFDAPNVDCVVLLRPTNSPGLYYQCVGRGFRLHPEKQDCLVLDFAGNILRHGPVDALQIKDKSTGSGEAPAKECPECQALIHAAYAVCPECGFEFPAPNKNRHEAQADTAAVLTGEIEDTEYTVQDVFYGVHTKRRADENTPRTMRVQYQVGWHHYVSEWVCPEHSGWARQKFEKWWSQRSMCPPPRSAHEAVLLADDGALARTKMITVRSVSGEKFDRVIGCELGEKPEYAPEPGWDDEVEEENVFEPSSMGTNWDEEELPF